MLGGNKQESCFKKEIEELVKNRHEKGTRERYQQAYDTFNTFRRHSKNISLEHSVKSYLTSLLLDKGLAPSTIRQQWAGIKALLDEEGTPITTQMESEIRKLLAGISKRTKEKPAPPQLELSTLNEMIKRNRLRPIRYQVTTALITLMWWALLRISEVIGQRNTPNRFLRLDDIRIKRNGIQITKDFNKGDEMELRIRSSKTDSIGEGTTHWFSRTTRGNGPTEAAILIKQTANKNGRSEDTPVSEITTPPISNKDILNVLHEVNKELSTHSMRRGGAIHLVRANIPWTSTKVLGRWKSDAAPQMYTRDHQAMNIDRVKSVHQGHMIVKNQKF